MNAMKMNTWRSLPANRSIGCFCTSLQKTHCVLLALLAISASVAAHAERKSTTAPVAATYEIAFASFAPFDADLFIADADGSNAKPFLPHTGFDGNGSFSRDGKWIVFTSERDGSYDIYRAHPDGSGLKRLVDDPAYDDQAALSPDGKSLAFVSSRSGNADIWILEIATKKLRNVTNHPAGDFRPAWSPDGQWLAFTTDRDSKKLRPNGFVVRHSTQIYLIRADGTGLRRVTQTQSFVGSPTWSPDGKQLVFYEAEFAELGKITAVNRRARGTTQIATVDLTTNEYHVLTSGLGEKWSPRFVTADRVAYSSGGPEGGLEFINGMAGTRGEVSVPSWSPDLKRMLFHRDIEQAWPPFQRWHSKDPQFRLVRTGVFPAYDPTGGRLLTNDGPGAVVSKNIIAMNTDGSQQRVFVGGGEKSALGPAWSPAGDRVAFALGRFFQMTDGPAIADIAVVNRDGTGLKVLTDGSANRGFPSWSPDGGQIVYRASGKDNMGLFVMTLDTGAVRPLTPGSSHDNFPAWSPRGDRIAFTRFFDSDYELYTVKPDGTDVHRLTNEAGNDAHCAWSPDGEWLAFSSERGGFKDEAALHPANSQPYGDIYVMRADGSDVRQLTDTPFEEGSVAWAPLRR
jgi:Tol biopolymer transport system component